MIRGVCPCCLGFGFHSLVVVWTVLPVFFVEPWLLLALIFSKSSSLFRRLPLSSVDPEGLMSILSSLSFSSSIHLDDPLELDLLELACLRFFCLRFVFLLILRAIAVEILMAVAGTAGSGSLSAGISAHNFSYNVAILRLPVYMIFSSRVIESNLRFNSGIICFKNVDVYLGEVSSSPRST